MTTIEQHTGDMLAVPSGILVHGCNALGVMGSGIALAVRKQYPGAYQLYRDRFDTLGLTLGEVIYADVSSQEPGTGRKIIANAITQATVATYPGELVVSYEAIGACFRDIARFARAAHLPVHFPLIGCGLGGGDWAQVSAIIEEALGPEIEKHLWTL